MGEHFSTQEFAGRPKRVPLTDVEYLNEHIRKTLKAYQREAAQAQFVIDAASAGGQVNKELLDTISVGPGDTNDKIAHKAGVVLRRKQKAIANWTAKLLCTHVIQKQKATIGGHIPSDVIRCSVCKTAKPRNM